MVDTLFAVFYQSTDGCSYSCDIIIGLFRTQDEADTALLGWVERAEMILGYRRIHEHEVAICQKEGRWHDVKGLKEEWEKFAIKMDIVDSGCPDENLDKYQIRQVSVGIIKDWL